MYQISTNSPSMNHIRKLEDLQSIAKDFLAKTAHFNIGVIISGGHKHLWTIVIEIQQVL